MYVDKLRISPVGANNHSPETEFLMDSATALCSAQNDREHYCLFVVYLAVNVLFVMLRVVAASTKYMAFYHQPECWSYAEDN
jgi:hypothetical protein